MSADAGGVAARITAWELFTALIATPDGRAEVATPDLVEALLNRDALEEDLRRGLADAKRVERADERYRDVARLLHVTTHIALYRADRPTTAWWWSAGTDVPPSEEVLNVPGAAQLKGVHEHTVRAAIARGQLTARRLGRGFVIQRSDVLAWQPRGVGRPPIERPQDPVFVDFISAIKSQDWARADKAAERARQDPSNGERAAVVAHALYAQGGSHEVLEWIGRAKGAGIAPRGEPVLAVLHGLTLARLGRSQEALGVLRDATRARPDDPGPIGGLAAVLFDSGAAEEARALLEDAVARLDDPGDLEFLLSEQSFRAGHFGAAMRHVTRFRERHPVHPEAQLLEGVILGQLGDETEDSLAYEEALELFEESNLPQRAQFVAITLARLDRWKEAIETSVALDTEARSIVVRAALLSALRSGGLPAAFDAARLAQRLIGTDPLTRSLLALEASSAEPREAQGLLTAGFGRYGSDDEAAISTIAWIAAGQAGPAVTSLSKALDDPESSSTRLVLLARAASAAGWEKEAIQAFERIATFNDEVGVLAQVALQLLSTSNGEDRRSSAGVAAAAWIDADTAAALAGRGPERGTETLFEERAAEMWGQRVLETFASSKHQ
jgi:excisionase family DNA binding protein